MRRLFFLLLFAPLVALAQPDEGTFTLRGNGTSFNVDGAPLVLTGQARFGGVAPGMDVPPGTNSVLTFEADDGSRAVLYSKDVYRLGLSASNLPTVVQNTGTTAYAPPYEVVSGDPEDFGGLSLFDLGMRLDLADGRSFYSAGRPSGPSYQNDIRVSRSTDESVQGRIQAPMRRAGSTASSSIGSVTVNFDATPSETPMQGLEPGQALVVVTGEHEMMAVLPASWGRGTETSGCVGCNPWILRFGSGNLFAGNVLDIFGQRPADHPNASSGVGWGGFRPGASGQAPLGFVRSSMLYNVMLPGEMLPYHSAGRPGKPFDLNVSPGTAPYPVGFSNGLNYARIRAHNQGMTEDDRTYAGWTDFHAWKARMNPQPREVLAVVRISVRYHTPAGPSDPPEQTATPGMGMGGSFTARIQGTTVSGTATASDSPAGFQFQMVGASGTTPGLFTFGGRGDLRRRTYSLADPASGPPGDSQVIGSLSTTSNAGQQMSCTFQSGTLRVTSIADDAIEGTFRGNTQCRTQTGATVYRNITGGAFEAVRSMAGGQINLPECVDLPPGVQMPAGSPIPACAD